MKKPLKEYKVYLRETKVIKKQGTRNPKTGDRTPWLREYKYFFVNARSKEEAKKRVKAILNNDWGNTNEPTIAKETGTPILPKISPKDLPKLSQNYTFYS